MNLKVYKYYKVATLTPPTAYLSRSARPPAPDTHLSATLEDGTEEDDDDIQEEITEGTGQGQRSCLRVGVWPCSLLWGVIVWSDLLGVTKGCQDLCRGLVLLYYFISILVATRRGKNVLSIGKSPEPKLVPYVSQHIDGRPAM